MNERIRELAEQAEKYADDNFRGEPTYSEAYDSKFAELIIRECVEVAVKFHLAHPYTVEYQIKKHFGVE